MTLGEQFKLRHHKLNKCSSWDCHNQITSCGDGISHGVSSSLSSLMTVRVPEIGSGNKGCAAVNRSVWKQTNLWRSTDHVQGVESSQPSNCVLRGNTL